MQNLLKKEKGVTLIALVVTIVILIILAAVSMTMVLGNNGIFTQAQKGANSMASAEANTQEGFNSMSSEIDKILGENDGSESSDEWISKSESMVGYYADLNNDGEITLADDGFIYADISVGGSGTWRNQPSGVYQYEAVKSGLNEYIVKSETTNLDPFKTGNGIIQLSKKNTTDRFYVMALEDVNLGTPYCWYAEARYKLDKGIASEYNDFGEGRTNSEYVMGKWNSDKLPWGAHDGGREPDMWGALTPKFEKGWFVPSKSEWSAFGDVLYDLGLTWNQYVEFGLSPHYWSSSIKDSSDAYRAVFNTCIISKNPVDAEANIRLSRRF